MNHHSFRELVKEMPVETIRENKMNPAHFKAVCFVLSMYGDYETGTRIRPSWLTVAREAGVDRKTAMKVRDYLLKIGAINRVGTTEANISIYEFGDQMSILQFQMSNSSDQMSNIDGQNTTYNSTNYITVKDQEDINYEKKKEANKFLEKVFS